MQAARHRGHLVSAEYTGTAAPGAYRTLKRGPERKEEDTGSLTHAWLSRAPALVNHHSNNPVPTAAERMRNDARPRVVA
ncbi:hypothetical protein EVAR_38314_1 [Eumeta japonica]|uniref:Uncharacterized protein n=1 Tax=Eumeta variegata TaxID=151549 RepID=A0A4C1W9L2_EUMVA|nr:hypothetical protein EVAR_38314_1 [Eumeta japonica]